MKVDTSRWSGEGEFTGHVVETLKRLPEIVFLRVEDAPATRAEAGYNFISNEIYVRFASRRRVDVRKRFGVLRFRQVTEEPIMTIPELEARLASHDLVGPADYCDDTMIQYLKTQRIVPPYQTRGYKLVELLRLYPVPGGR